MMRVVGLLAFGFVLLAPALLLGMDAYRDFTFPIDRENIYRTRLRVAQDFLSSARAPLLVGRTTLLKAGSEELCITFDSSSCSNLAAPIETEEELLEAHTLFELLKKEKRVFYLGEEDYKNGDCYMMHACVAGIHFRQGWWFFEQIDYLAGGGGYCLLRYTQQFARKPEIKAALGCTGSRYEVLIEKNW